jgi:hypothetical protein
VVDCRAGELDGDDSDSDNVIGEEDDEEDYLSDDDQPPHAKGKQQQQQQQQQNGRQKPGSAAAAAAARAAAMANGSGGGSSREMDDSDADSDGETAAAVAGKQKQRQQQQQQGRKAGGKAGFYAETQRGFKQDQRTFQDLNLSRPLLRAVAALGYTQPTPIQVRCKGQQDATVHSFGLQPRIITWRSLECALWWYNQGRGLHPALLGSASRSCNGSSASFFFNSATSMPKWLLI